MTISGCRRDTNRFQICYNRLELKLIELDPEFWKIVEPNKLYSTDASFDEADGICFLCPKCFRTNGGPVGTHRVLCWRPHVPQTEEPVPGRWEFRGNGFSDLSLVAGSSSILLTAGCRWHGFVENGSIRDC
jgi:hypothetical protein